MIRYIRLNIFSMLRNHPGIFLLIFISEALTALCVLFSYGVIVKMQDEEKKQEDLMFYYSYDLTGKTELSEKFMTFFDVMKNDLDDASASVTVKDKNGDEKSAWAGISFVEPEKNLDEQTCDLNEINAAAVENNKVIICGVEFSVRDIRPNAGLDTILDNPENAMGDDYLIPFGSIPDDAVGRYFQFTAKQRPTQEKIDQFDSVIREIFGVEHLYAPEPLDLMKKQESNTFYVYAMLIVTVAVINLSMYFRYIIELRRKQIQTFIICGATLRDINIIFLLENLIELVIGYSAAFLLFRFRLLRIIDSFYENFSLYYSARLYLVTSVIYVVLSLAVLKLLIGPHIRRAAAAGERGV